MPGKHGRCVWWENGDGMRHCDSSHADGSNHRWNCSDTIDSIQLPGKPRRNFIVIASGGQHTAVEEINKVKGSKTNRTHVLESSKSRFVDSLNLMQATKSHWDVISREGGRHIFIMPSQITYGLPGSVCGNHDSALMMEAMMDEHIREPLRRRTNLTCEHGLEILDTSFVFSGPLAPGSRGDGLHYTELTNTAILQLLAHRISNFNGSNWRQDTVGWNHTHHQDNSCS
jgi:hypothetical protein